ncbi:hypothetical protein Pcinc_040649 [Petrolisthes cinctipes]|uniref:Uncharacterized protein n=1 Tax=Petrolisthes cinctipes TaxID=88211 RepID=A0AAE1BPW1_PETCI|nr:hypothetical protein Pcinc_040649 [Petrolisthes cinctipes]
MTNPAFIYPVLCLDFLFVTQETRNQLSKPCLQHLSFTFLTLLTSTPHPSSTPHTLHPHSSSTPHTQHPHPSSTLHTQHPHPSSTPSTLQPHSSSTLHTQHPHPSSTLHTQQPHPSPTLNTSTPTLLIHTLASRSTLHVCN